jgi:hypothetical protein
MLPEKVKTQAIENELVEIVWSVLDAAENGHLSLTATLPSGDGQFHSDGSRTHYRVSQKDILERLEYIFHDASITVSDTKVCIDWSK